MGQMKIAVKTTVTTSEQPYVSNSVNNRCQTNATIRVPVPNGQTRYITIAYTSGDGIDETYTINTTTDVTLYLTGLQDDDGSLNDIYSSANVQVRLASGSSAYYVKQIVRNHTGNEC